MAYDPSYPGVVAFGGITATSSALGDTWVFQNGTWTDLTGSLTTAPSARWGAGLTYDPDLGGLVLFGGRDGFGNIFNDTWLFNSTGWHNLSIAHAPSPRTPYWSMVYDAADAEVVLFGGNYFTSYRLNDTWVFANRTWTDLTSNSTTAPPPYQFSAAYDPADGYTVFYGGGTWSNGGYALTWTFLGGAWTNRTATAGTPPDGTQGAASMAYDPDARAVIDYGGTDSGYGAVNSTWSFAGGRWTNVSSSVGVPPPGRGSGTMACDPALPGCLVFGGNTASYPPSANTYTNETWYLDDQLQVRASARPTVGVAPLSANFTALYGPGIGPFAFNWSFGDGSPNGTTLNASHTFTAPGTYRVEVTVTSNVTSRATANLSEVVYPALQYTAQASPGAGDGPLQVAFDSSGHGGVPTVREAWSFGDGGTSGLANVSHTYTAAGTFAWSLTVTDSQGDRAARFGNVTVFGPLTLETNATPPAGPAPLPVALHATAGAGDPPYAYSWTFGDGSPAILSENTTHTYARAGTYSANVTVTDTGGGRSVSTVTVVVVQPLNATTSVEPLLGEAPLTVSFSDAPEFGGAPYASHWSLGLPGVSSTAESGSYTYTLAGNYTINLTISDAFHETFNRSFEVRIVSPLAVALAAGTTRGLAPLNESFRAQLTGGLPPYTYLWTFGDGATSDLGPGVNHSYLTAGVFAVGVQVGSAAGGLVRASASVVVAPIPDLTVVASAPNVTVGATIVLTASVTGGFPAWTFAWSGLPPGCASNNTVSLGCTPTRSGSFTATVQATDSNGDRTTASVAFTVLPAPSSTGAAGLPLIELVGGVGVVAAVAIAAAVLALRRRRRPPAPPEGYGDEPAVTGEPPVG